MKINKFKSIGIVCACLMFFAISVHASDLSALVNYVNVDVLYQASISTNPPVIVDVRGAAEYNAKHIKGAVSWQNKTAPIFLGARLIAKTTRKFCLYLP